MVLKFRNLGLMGEPVCKGPARYPLLKEGSLSPIRKMQRYLSQGEAGEVRHEPPFSWKPLFDLPTPRRLR
jgi:hypothetical protein